MNQLPLQHTNKHPSLAVLRQVYLPKEVVSCNDEHPERRIGTLLTQHKHCKSKLEDSIEQSCFRSKHWSIRSFKVAQYRYLGVREGQHQHVIAIFLMETTETSCHQQVSRETLEATYSLMLLLTKVVQHSLAPLLRFHRRCMNIQDSMRDSALP